MWVRQILLAMLMAGAAAALATVKADAAEPIVVAQVASGRQFRGTLDESSTAGQLVLQTAANGITLRRPIDWRQIAAATIDGQPVPVAELRALAAEHAEPSDQKSGLRIIELRDKVSVEAANEDAPRAFEPQPVVTTLATYPYVANWDADVETDGLVVEVAPLDWNGALVAASGTLEVELFAAQRRVLYQAPLSGGDTLELVERWTRSVNATDFGPRGAIVRLPYGAIHPELRPDWMAGWYGIVHVKLSLPGHGVFEDSRDGVRVRPWAPLRDQLELNTGRRFLPTERLGRPD